MKLKRSQLINIIREEIENSDYKLSKTTTDEILAHDHPSEAKAHEDSWSGGHNVHHQEEHHKTAGSKEKMVRGIEVLKLTETDISRRQIRRFINEALGDRGDLPKKKQYAIGRRGLGDLPESPPGQSFLDDYDDVTVVELMGALSNYNLDKKIQNKEALTFNDLEKVAEFLTIPDVEDLIDFMKNEAGLNFSVDGYYVDEDDDEDTELDEEPGLSGGPVDWWQQQIPGDADMTDIGGGLGRGIALAKENLVNALYDVWQEILDNEKDIGDTDDIGAQHYAAEEIRKIVKEFYSNEGMEDHSQHMQFEVDFDVGHL